MDVTDLKEELLLLRKENAELRRTASAEKAALERRIDELCAEVEQLRVENAAFTGRSIRAGDKMACLEAENAKLRELVQDMYIDLICEYPEYMMEDYKNRLRKLGIEVSIR